VTFDLPLFIAARPRPPSLLGYRGFPHDWGFLATRQGDGSWIVEWGGIRANDLADWRELEEFVWRMMLDE
jgi:hypothetical protein